MSLLKVSSQEWEEAKKYFEENNDEVKFSKKMQGRNAQNNHSFIKVGDEIFVMANRHIAGEEKAGLLGEGAFGKVKMVQTQAGDNFAVKIEGRGARAENDTENKVMKLINYVKGEAVRKLPEGKRFKGAFTIRKLYTVTDLRKGDELFNFIYFDKDATKRKNLTEEQSLLIALKSCQAIEALHQKGIIHADIKPENFMADIQGNQIVVESIDFGHSMILAQGQNQIIARKPLGSEMFNAPEVTFYRKHSFASDIYALGVMLEDDLLLYKNPQVKALIEKMTDERAGNRPSMNEVISTLTAAWQAKNLMVNLPTESKNISNKVSQEKVEDSDAQAKKLMVNVPTESENISNKVSQKKVEDGDARAKSLMVDVPTVNENIIDKFSKENVENSYKQKSQFSSRPGMLLNFAKSAGKAMFDKGKKREAQIDLIVNTAEKLKNNNTLTPDERIKIMYAVLTKVESDIKNKETNMITSGMMKMCVEYKKDISVSAQSNPELQKSLKEINQKGQSYQNIVSSYVDDAKVQKKDNPKLKN